MGGGYIFGGGNYGNNGEDPKMGFNGFFAVVVVVVVAYSLPLAAALRTLVVFSNNFVDLFVIDMQSQKDQQNVSYLFLEICNKEARSTNKQRLIRGGGKNICDWSLKKSI